MGWFSNSPSHAKSDPRDSQPSAVPAGADTATAEEPARGGSGKVRWWERDKQVIEWVRRHPSTIQQVADLFFDGNYKQAAHCLARLRRKGKIPHLTVIPRDTDGRPQYQYAGWMVGYAAVHEYY